MSARSDVVVIGAGVIGLASAWRLAQRGLAVTLIERGAPGAGASGASLGVLMPAPADRDSPVHRFQRASLWAYPQFVDELRTASGVDPAYRRCGHLELFGDPIQRARAERWIPSAGDWPSHDGQPPVTVLDHGDIERIAPGIAPTPCGGLVCRATAHVRVELLIAALATACSRSGVTVRTRRSVDAIDLTGGRVGGVRCGSEHIACGQVLVAAGAWTSRLAPCLAHAAPIDPVGGVALRLRTAQPAVDMIVKRGSTYIIPRGAEEVIVGATTDRRSGADARVTARAVARLTRNAVDMMPGLADAGVAASWAGLRPKSRTGGPVIGPVPGASGLVVAAGHYKTGLCMAPLTAELVCGLMIGHGLQFDASCFAPPDS